MKTIKYGLREKNTGLLVEVYSEKNGKDRYACCEISFYLIMPEKQDMKRVWLVSSPEICLETMTAKMEYYNADHYETPVNSILHNKYEDDEFEIVEVVSDVTVTVVSVN